MIDWSYCPRCGSSGDILGGAENPYFRCPSCEFTKFNNPACSTIAIIPQGQKLLLAKRASAPQLGLWDAVGGFIHPGESAESCVLREAQEETGHTFEISRLLGTFPSVYGESGIVTLGIAFELHATGPLTLKLSEENSAFQWFDCNNLPQVAFADVASAIDAWLSVSVR